MSDALSSLSEPRHSSPAATRPIEPNWSGRRSSAPAASALDTVAEIETPEHVRFRFNLAGPLRRGAAYAVDTFVRFGIITAFGLMAAIGGLVSGFESSGYSGGVMLTLAFLLEWGYFVLLETLMGGQSIGKRAFGLRVVTRDGRPLGFTTSVLRNLLRAADFLPLAYALGFFVVSADRNFRRLGDLAAGTLVIAEPRRRAYSPVKVQPPTPQELGSVPANVNLSRAELDAIELFLRRHGTLPPTREDELAEIIAPSLAERFNVRYRDASRFLALIYWKAIQRPV